MQEGDGKKYLLKIVAVVCLVGVVFISISVWKEMKKKKEIQEKIAQLQEEADRISRENSSLEEKIAYFGSDEYKQKEAKDKLNLQSPGESVVIIKKNAPKEEIKTEEDAEPLSTAENRQISVSNPKKWWHYFFGY